MDAAIFIFVIALRLLAPLSILRWPLGGMFLAIFADAIDVMIFSAQGGPASGGEKLGYKILESGLYHNFDKFFDIYYLFFAYLVTRRWTDGLAKNTAAILFWWRFAGFLLFESALLFGAEPRIIFVFTPAIFENFYIAWFLILRFFPRFQLTPARLFWLLLIVGLPKIIQEYLMHYLFTGGRVWAFFRDTFFWWIY